MDMQARIRQIVQEHSGGVKLVELVTELTMQSYKAGRGHAFDVDAVILCVEADPTLNAHEYAWNMGAPYADGVHREKVFVHQI